jgi:osmotically-inducible protein OsmY
MKTDLEIQKDVTEEIKWEPSLTNDNIRVSVNNRIVTLTGTADAYYKKNKALKAANRVIGVKSVIEKLDVRLPSAIEKTDSEIRDAVLNELKWHSSVAEDKVKVKVANGIVTLDGEVEWDFQRTAIRHAIENLTGVKGIINNLTVVPKLTASEIKQKINAAFHRNATIDAGKINVETSGNKVILTGKVRSWMEKNEAENTAWLAPGVEKVENKIEIEY